VNHEFGISAASQFVQVEAEAFAIGIHAERDHAIEEGE
jgi:hypothetical protein